VTFTFSQSKYTEYQVEKSTDPQVIANFIKYNPDHKRTPEFKRKLSSLVSGGNTDSQDTENKKPTQYNIKTTTKNNSNNKHEDNTVNLLNNLFNSDPSSKTAYLQIINKSKCDLIVKINGTKLYNLNVPANNQNFVLVDKGNYNISSSVCGAQYSSTKDIMKDIVITLNSVK
jgi:hypothetical protein